MNDDEVGDDDGLGKYQDQIGWFKDTKFLQDLESDSVDSEILDEEFSALQEEENPISTREKVVKCLQSNPVQILLCVLVLLDAGIVIAQILLDLNSVRNRLNKREEEILELLGYFKDMNELQLDGYHGNDVSYILQILRDHKQWTISAQENKLNSNDSSAAEIVTDHHRKRRSSSSNSSNGDYDISNNDNRRSPEMGRTGVDAGKNDDSVTGGSHAGSDPRSVDMQNLADGNGTREEESMTRNSSCYARCMQTDVFHVGLHNSDSHLHHVEHEEHDILLELAHGLHFASIAILGFLVVVDFVKIVAMGKAFFQHKIEIFDAVIILGSFAFDIVFLGGVSGREGQKAAAVLIVLLLWRIARVADGIVITVKQRQELRIRLQKRARRRAEKRIDSMEEERHNRIRQVMALKELCASAGVTQADIESCTPQAPQRRKSTTMTALSSIARFSFSMTMSMSSGLFSMAEEENANHVEAPPVRPSQRRLSWGGPGDAEKAPSRGGLLWRLTRRSGQLAMPPPIPASILEKYRNKGSNSSIELAMQEYRRAPSPPPSPPNNCGIEIVIDGGSDSPSSDSEQGADEFAPNSPDTPDSDSFLNVDYMADSRRSSNSSGSSRVYLLNEVR